MNNDDYDLKFFDSWHKNEEVPYEINNEIQNKCEDLNTLFEDHFSLDNFESSRVKYPYPEKSIK
jgi:hypothetical protein